MLCKMKKIVNHKYYTNGYWLNCILTRINTILKKSKRKKSFGLTEAYDGLEENDKKTLQEVIVK